MIQLPDHCPSRLTYQPPIFPVKTFRAISGVACRVLYGNRSSQARLSMELALSNAGAAEWLVAFETARSEFDPVALSSRAFDAAPEIEATIPATITWHFAGQPTVERVSSGRTRVGVELIGDLEV